jgi:glucosamine-6-phosphate deaminase
VLDSSQILIFENDQELAIYAAAQIYQQLSAKLSPGNAFVLGCPGGRTPRQTYIELGKLIGVSNLSLENLWIIMMDDYAERTETGFQNVAEQNHFSCQKFAKDEIQAVLNAALPAPKQLPAAQVVTPAAANPAAYEQLVAKLGIDLFILASGATDGHIAFNGPGSTATDRTRIVELAETTRRDNLLTFPEFKSLAEVPSYGITIGPATIKDYAKSVLMLLIGESKTTAFNRITSAAEYEADWPATITVECNNILLLADRAAATS